MVSVYDTLHKWAVRTSSSFAELGLLSSGREDIHPGTDTQVLRLKHWPDLPARHRTAGVYRALSVMSSRPVNRSWFLRHSGMHADDLDGLIDTLIAQGALEKLDISAFAAK